MRPVGAATAVMLIARLTLRRILRSGGVWWAAGVAFLPVVLAGALSGHDGRSAGTFRDMFLLQLGLLAIIPALLLGPAIADEKDEKTMTYLWSRPIARWTVLGGKLLALVPICAALTAASVAATFQITWGDPSERGALVRAAAGMAAGSLAAGSLAATLGTMLPKHPMAFAVMYMALFDVPLGLVPMKLQALSITYQVTQLAQVSGGAPSMGSAVIWLAGMTTAWLALAVWRIGRLE